MEALTSVGTSRVNVKSKSSFNLSEHGIGIKLNSLRLAATTLIITKTKPTFEPGTQTYFISIGLLSTEFMKKTDASNGFLIAPIVTYEVKNKRISKSLTPEPEHFLQMIS